jgi:hypothetical protein
MTNPSVRPSGFYGTVTQLGHKAPGARWAKSAIKLFSTASSAHTSDDLRVMRKNYGPNWAQSEQRKGLASLQALDLMVAGTGFEPVTFGL